MKRTVENEKNTIYTNQIQMTNYDYVLSAHRLYYHVFSSKGNYHYPHKFASNKNQLVETVNIHALPYDWKTIVSIGSSGENHDNKAMSWPVVGPPALWHG